MMIPAPPGNLGRVGYISGIVVLLEPPRSLGVCSGGRDLFRLALALGGRLRGHEVSSVDEGRVASAGRWRERLGRSCARPTEARIRR